jgi:predicted acylesterase/phospholipase RssA
VEDISHLTHPNISVLSAIQMTSALPILLTPMCIDDKCYVDGGMSCNYPLNYCIESGKQPDEILGFKNKYSESKNNITADSTLLEFLMSFMYKAVFSLSTDKKQPVIPNEVICDVSHLNFEFLKKSITSIEVRKELFDSGVNSGKTFLEKNTSISSNESLEDSIQELN